MKSRKYYRSLVREATRQLNPIKRLEREIQDLEKAVLRERRRADQIEKTLAEERHIYLAHANHEQWMARRGWN
mgnify:CR=1 FL=1